MISRTMHFEETRTYARAHSPYNELKVFLRICCNVEQQIFHNLSVFTDLISLHQADVILACLPNQPVS